MSEFDYNKITAEVITDLAKSSAKAVWGKITQTYKDISNKGDIDYGMAFEKYLTESEKYISMAKTILYGQIPHHLYSFFECMGIKNKDKEIDTSNVNNILSLGHKLIITGTGGIGKSMLMRHCFLDAITNTTLIPILIELRGLNEYALEDISIEKYIYNTLNIFGFKLEEKYFRYSLETGCYLFLFDGYDEVKNSLSSKVTQEITDFSNKYMDNYMIVSSRPLEEFVGWSDFIEFSSMNLTKEQALSLISKLEYDEELKKKFYEKLDEELYDKYNSFASNPLLLTIMLMTFEGRVSIPDSKTDFYEQAFSTLFHRHDARKRGGYKREIQSGLGYEDFKKVFSYFCFRSFFKNQYEFTEKTALENIAKAKEKTYSFGTFEDSNFLNDMVKAACVLVHEGLNYRFSHRSFQEYFAAVYTTQLSDDEQKKFVTSWLKTTSRRITTDFLDILHDLQPDRFMKNILYDPLCDLNKKYESHNKDNNWIIQYLFSGIGVRRNNENDFSFFLTVKESYYNTIVRYMLRYAHYDFNSFIDEEKDEINNIAEELLNKYCGKYSIDFEQLIEDGLYEKALKCVEWAVKQIDFVLKELKNIDTNTFGRKRTFESMLEDL